MSVSEWGISPSDYWKMSPSELGEIIEFNTPPETHAGKPAEFWDEMIERSNGEGFI